LTLQFRKVSKTSIFLKYSAEKLIGDLSGIYSYHFKKGNAQYRISYTIDKTEKIVYILMIGKRENFYQILRRRL